MTAETYETALVLGLGASGEEAARLLLAEGTRVTVADSGDGAPLRRAAAELERAGAAVTLGRPELPAGTYGGCIVSPGISCQSAWVKEIEARGVRVLSELELGWRRRRSRIVAVTGSNGKSTAVKLCADALGRAGWRAAPGGNFGPPVLKLVRETAPPDWLVVEVSSFQLERVDHFRPEVGVLLNIHPNHLDRHGDMETYAGLKARLFARMQPGDAAIVFEDALGAAARFASPPGGWTVFGSSERADYRYGEGHVRWLEKRNPGLDVSREGSISVSKTLFDNQVLGLTAAAVSAAVSACGSDPEYVAAAARSFQALPHRMTVAGEIGGVRFVDNSKATNLAATAASLKMIDGPVMLIAGGLLKETDLVSISKTFAGKLRGAYLIGKAAKAMSAAWGASTPCHLCSDLTDAVWRAWRDAERGDTVLLSPGCASFDQFTGFEERGKRFVDVVGAIKEDREKR